MSRFRIHPQLIADCHRLGRFEACHLLLHGNALLPWFILVPETSVIDLLDLDARLRTQVMDEAAAISRYVKDALEYPRANVAAIGNLVPQLHLHVIGRRPDDVCWPLPVWGHLRDSATYDQARLDEISMRLASEYGLVRPA